MRVELNYGKGKLPVDLPNEWEVQVIRKKFMPVEADPTAAVRAALASPVGAPRLAETARGCKSACILICGDNLLGNRRYNRSFFIGEETPLARRGAAGQQYHASNGSPRGFDECSPAEVIGFCHNGKLHVARSHGAFMAYSCTITTA